MIEPNKWRPRLLALLRMMSGLLFVEHGIAKIFHFPAFAQYDAVVLQSLAGFAGMIEIIGGALVTIGLFTRQSAFILAGQMAVAYFLYHAPQSFYPLQNGGEPAILFCFIFLYLIGAGGGAWSFDNHREKRRTFPDGGAKPA